MVWNLKEHRRSLPTTENRTRVIAEGDFLVKKAKHSFHFLTFFAFLAIFVFALIQMGYAQADTGQPTTVPEPASLALISTGGIVSYLLRFARKRFQQFKRCFDVVVSVIGLVITAPIIAVTAIIIKFVSPGPVFFRQERVGLGGAIFNMHKVRTMRIDAEKETGPVWAKENDERLIKFGGIIRKTHIDEIPQLINVLKGEMSIIGPRPERPIFVKELKRKIPDYTKRLAAKPGITGLAQVRHKYDETIQDVKRKIKLDLLYIRKMCLWVDMRILAMTVLAVLTGKGAR